jgi:hypothetical protein
MKRQPKFLLAIFLLAGCLLALEIGVRAWLRFAAASNRLDVEPEEGSRLPMFGPHPALVFAPTPNGKYRETRWAGDKKLYSVSYAFDPLGRRLIPTPMSAKPRRNLLFFGCSYTFGHGVEADDTFPSRFATLRDEYRPYVYAVNGYGPQQMWRQIHGGIAENEGDAVYTFFDHHLQRLWGSMKFVNSWGGPFSHLRKMADGEIVSLGPFNDTLGSRLRAYHLLGRFRTFDLLPLDLPLFPSSEQKRLLADVLIDASEMFRKKTGGRLHVVIFPGSRFLADWLPSVRQAGIPVYDYSKMYGRKEDRYWIPGDGHPSGEGYKAVAEQFARDFR